jgi:prevent-host-death family protein
MEIATIMAEVITWRQGMVTVTAKQLKQKTGEIIRRVKSGERLTVTHRGRPVAVILPPPEKEGNFAEELPPFEKAWEEIEASLKMTKPEFRNWHEAMTWARREHSS